MKSLALRRTSSRLSYVQIESIVVKCQCYQDGQQTKTPCEGYCEYINSSQEFTFCPFPTISGAFLGAPSNEMFHLEVKRPWGLSCNGARRGDIFHSLTIMWLIVPDGSPEMRIGLRQRSLYKIYALGQGTTLGEHQL